MSTPSVEHEAPTFPGEDVAHEVKHPTDATYVKVAAILAGLTALEVSTYFLDFGPLFLPVLITLMVIKFLTVVSYFMHLKFDSPVLRKAFYAGLILALCVYLTALSTFHFWGRP
jgi:cytochrome c oxidase subunit IV